MADPRAARYEAQRRQLLQRIRRSEERHAEMVRAEEAERLEAAQRRAVERERRAASQRALQQRIRDGNRARAAMGAGCGAAQDAEEYRALVAYFQRPRREYQAQLRQRYDRLVVSRAALRQTNPGIYYGLLHGMAHYRFDRTNAMNALQPHIHRRLAEARLGLVGTAGRAAYSSVYGTPDGASNTACTRGRDNGGQYVASNGSTKGFNTHDGGCTPCGNGRLQVVSVVQNGAGSAGMAPTIQQRRRMEVLLGDLTAGEVLCARKQSVGPGRRKPTASSGCTHVDSESARSCPAGAAMLLSQGQLPKKRRQGRHAGVTRGTAGGCTVPGAKRLEESGCASSKKASGAYRPTRPREYHFAEMATVGQLRAVCDLQSLYRVYTFVAEELGGHFLAGNAEMSAGAVRRATGRLDLERARNDVSELRVLLERLVAGESDRRGRAGLDAALRGLLGAAVGMVCANIRGAAGAGARGGTLDRTTAAAFAGFLDPGRLVADERFMGPTATRLRLLVKSLAFVAQSRGPVAPDPQLAVRLAEDLDRLEPADFVQTLLQRVVDSVVVAAGAEACGDFYARVAAIAADRTYLDKLCLVLDDIKAHHDSAAVFPRFVDFLRGEMATALSFCALDDAPLMAPSPDSLAEGLRRSLVRVGRGALCDRYRPAEEGSHEGTLTTGRARRRGAA